MTSQSERTWLARGERHQREGRTVDALVCYREAIAADRHSIQAQFHLGEVLRDLNRNGDAFAAWREVLTLQPQHLPALLAFGDAALRVGQHGEAAEAYRRALTSAPHDTRAGRGLALARLAAGDADGYRGLMRALADRGMDDVGEIGDILAELLLKAPRSRERQTLLADLGRRGTTIATPLLAAIVARDAALRGDRALALAMLDAAEADAEAIDSLEALRLYALGASRVAPGSPWPARYAARCMEASASDAPYAWPRRTAGATLRVAWLSALDRPLVFGGAPMDPAIYLREVVAAGSRERIESAICVLDDALPSTLTATIESTTAMAIGAAPGASIAQALAEADFDAIVDLAGMTRQSGPLLARQPSRSVWTIDGLFAAHAPPLVTRSLPAPRSAAGDDLRAHSDEIEARLRGLLPPLFASGAGDAPPPQAMAKVWRDAVRAHQAGEEDAAIAAYAAVLELQPGYARAHFLMGLACRERRRPEAEQQLAAALRAAPGFVDARTALANELREHGRCDEAVELCKRGLSAAPEARALWRALGLAELACERNARARVAFDRALALDPGDAETHYNRGVALQAGGKRRAALHCYARSLALDPGLAAACYNSGVVLREQGRLDAAIAAFEGVLAQEPAQVAAHNALCETLREAGRSDDWLRAFRRFEAQCPDALTLAAQALEACQYLADFAGLDRYLDGLSRDVFAARSDTEHADCLETLLFLILYFDIDPAQHFRLYQTYAALAPRVYGPPVSLPARRRTGRIRVGYLSGDLRDHVMGRMMFEAVRRHDRSRFEVFFYSLSPVDDEWTARYRSLGDRMIALGDADERAAAARIAEDDLDLLVDLATSTRGARPGILALKPARVQISHVASAGVVGLREIDYKLTDAFADTPDNQAGQIETLLPMEGCVYPYRHVAPAAGHGYRRDRLGISEDAVLIAAFVNPMKLSRRCLVLWREVLERIPQALLVLSPLSAGPGAAQRRLLAAAGIGAARTVAIAAGHDEAENQARYHLIDMVLDPMPYGGVNGTLEALDMGVAVVTLCGRRHGERSSYSILANLGVRQTIAHSEAEYIAIAARLASDRSFMAEVRTAIRAGLARSPLTDMDAHTRHLERAYLTALEERYPAALADG